MYKLESYIQNLNKLDHSQLCYLLENFDEDALQDINFKAREISKKIFNNKIFVRGIIEFSNYCKNDCFYCGIRKSNSNIKRYRFGLDEILMCATRGYELGIRSFVLQSGEDKYFCDDILCEIIAAIKQKYPDCAVVLSIGERSYESYQSLFDAGAERFLLRHEAINNNLYEKIHPNNLLLKNRINCLKNLKKIGYQTGCGMMIGVPYQTTSDIANDILFMKDFQPHMIGIGPFIPHKDTPFANFNQGNVNLTLFVLSILRILIPNSLIPATTALASSNKEGRISGILAGANVVMPNLTPAIHKKNYDLYNTKNSFDDSPEFIFGEFRNTLNKHNYDVIIDKGDWKA